MIDVIERRLTEPGAPGAIVQLRVLGGAMARVPGDATAFGWRDRPALLWLITPDKDLARAAANEAWTAAFRADLPADGPANYVNFMGDEGAAAVRDAYPASLLRTPARAQASLRPRQRLSRQPQHPPGVAPGRRGEESLARPEGIGRARTQRLISGHHCGPGVPTRRRGPRASAIRGARRPRNGGDHERLLGDLLPAQVAQIDAPARVEVAR